MLELHLPKLIAHRGAPRLAPENTLPSLQAAKSHGALWTEFDVTLTADNTAVVFHDEILNRTTNGHGFIHDKTYAQLKELDAGSWFHPTFQQIKIPTLEEYLRQATQLQLGVNIELKTQLPGKSELLAKTVLLIIKQCWPNDLPTPLLSSFSTEILIALRQSDCPYPIALNIDQWSSEQILLAESLQCYSVHCNAKQISQEHIALHTAHHCRTLAYTVNDKAKAEWLFSIGVNAIFSDIPDLLSSE